MEDRKWLYRKRREWADARASMDKANKNSVSAVGAEKDVKYTEK